MRWPPLVLAAALAACGGQDRVIVAAGTTLEDSGILRELVMEYEQTRAVEISVVGDATLRVLDLGRRGGAQVLITHSPAAEEAFGAEGLAASRSPFAVGEFVLVGPADRVSLLAGMTPEQAFGRIAAEEWVFLTRADGSGTEAAERGIWAAAGVEPSGDWYGSTGLGMGATLQIAAQRDAFTLAEEGTYLAAMRVLRSAPVDLVASDLLANPYHVIVVSGASEEAHAFAEWLVSAEGRQALRRANEKVFGEQVLEAPEG